MTKEEREAYKGKRIIGKPFTELDGRTGIIYKMNKIENLTIIFDDKPGIRDGGYLLEEVDFV
jgi:hypothetical protein